VILVGAAFCRPHNARMQMMCVGQIAGGRMPPLQNWYPVWRKPNPDKPEEFYWLYGFVTLSSLQVETRRARPQ